MGNLVGFTLEIIVGLSVGVLVTETEGNAVVRGFTVGVLLGVAVEMNVGTAEGVLLGVAVGVVGCGVGESVGPDGVSVGRTVGLEGAVEGVAVIRKLGEAVVCASKAAEGEEEGYINGEYNKI